MNTPYSDSTEFIDAEDLKLCQDELLDNARNLDHFGKRFQRFMSMELQKLELAIDRFEREKEAWNRQREREIQELKTQLRTNKSQSSVNVVSQSSTKSEPSKIHCENSNSTAPLLLLIQPGTVSAMQLGLLLFEISKMNREFGGGGVRFEVSKVKLPKQKSRRAGNSPIIGIEAFSFVPLLSYDGSPTREMKSWERFKSDFLLSSLLDNNLLKLFKKSDPAPRDHESVALAQESTLRAENANVKCDSTVNDQFEGFVSNKRTQHPKEQQLQRVEDVFRYLNKEYGLRMHLSLVW